MIPAKPSVKSSADNPPDLMPASEFAKDKPLYVIVGRKSDSAAETPSKLHQRGKKSQNIALDRDSTPVVGCIQRLRELRSLAAQLMFNSRANHADIFTKQPGKNFKLTFIVEAGDPDAPCRLVLAHGAGAGIASSFFEAMTKLLAARDMALTAFEFAYMASRREGGPKRPPPKAEMLTSEYRDVVRSLTRSRKAATKIVIGGKSLGGRVASLIADELYREGAIAGLVCLGYPFHPPKTPEKLRTAHLEVIKCPTLIVQGERDPFGGRSEVEAMPLSKKIEIVWIGDGDHDFGPRGSSGFTRKGNLASAADAVAAFVARLPDSR